MSTGSSRGAQDVSRFAPKWARDPEHNGSVRRPARDDGDIWLGDAEEAARDNFRSREGDVKLGLFRPPLEPTVIPDAWSAPPRRSKARRFLGLAVAGLAVTTVVVGVITWGPGSVGGESVTRLVAPRPAAETSTAEDRARASNRRLVVSTPASAFPTDEGAPLGLAIEGSGPRSDVVIGGFAPGSTFSTGQALGRSEWVLSPWQIAGAVIMPPPGFGGAMDLVFALRLRDGRVVDRKRTHLEWSHPGPVAAPNVPPPAPAPAAVAAAAAPSQDTSSGPRTLSVAELAALFKRGNEMVSRGDLVGARLFFERAAQAGDPGAALALASTYDPLVLQRLGERGLAPDIAMARFWYEKAKQLGSKEAPERLEVLVSRSGNIRSN